MTERPSEVPLVQESYWFVAADEERLRAMQAAQRAASDEGRLEATLVVTSLWQRQINEATEIMAEIRKQHEPGDPRTAHAAKWLGAWVNEAEQGFVQWADYQAGLVGAVGKERAEQLAQGSPTARMESVKARAKELIYADVRAKGIDIAALRDTGEGAAEPSAGGGGTAVDDDMKVCPDCAEEVKAAARKCRYCGYRFDEATA